MSAGTESDSFTYDEYDLAIWIGQFSSPHYQRYSCHYNFNIDSIFLSNIQVALVVDGQLDLNNFVNPDQPIVAFVASN